MFWIVYNMNLRRMDRLFSHFNFSLRRMSLGLCAALLLGSVGVSYPSQGVMEGFEKEIQGIFERTKDSVVQIKTILPVTDVQKGDVVAEALSIGSGFFVNTNGMVMTAASVLHGCTNAVVYWRGKPHEAQVVGQDPRTNLALLKIDAETPCLPMGDPELLKVGSMALAVGYPADAPISAEYGFISNTDAAQTPRFFTTTHIRSSIRAQPGQSGSPFLNSKGEVVGMVVYSMEDGSSTFALPITAARKVQNDLVQFHAPRQGWTGMTIEVKSNLQSQGDGIAVRDVYEGCPGHRAGINSGDVILKIGEKQIHSPADVMNATFYLSIGEKVNFTISRDGEEKVVPVDVVSRPSDKEMSALRLVAH